MAAAAVCCADTEPLAGLFFILLVISGILWTYGLSTSCVSWQSRVFTLYAYDETKMNPIDNPIGNNGVFTPCSSNSKRQNQTLTKSHEHEKVSATPIKLLYKTRSAKSHQTRKFRYLNRMYMLSELVATGGGELRAVPPAKHPCPLVQLKVEVSEITTNTDTQQNLDP